MDRETIQALLARREAAWRTADAAALALTHTEDGVVVSPMFVDVKGRAAIEASYAALFTRFTKWEYVTDAPIIDGDRLAVPFSARATHEGEFMGLSGTGRRFGVEGVLLMAMRNGLVQHERRLYDFTGLLIQTGVLRGSRRSDVEIHNLVRQ